MKKQETNIQSLKKSMLLLTLLSSLLLLLQACNQDDTILPSPKAGFEITTDPENSFKISFVNTSENASNYSWNFGDENTSSETSPVHTYESAGNYEVTLTATNGVEEDIFKLDVKLETPSDPERYIDLIFSSVSSKSGSYGSFSSNNFEFFEPMGDTETSRPLIILSPGGNHTSFTRKEELVEMCKDLAKRGYAAAYIEYAQVTEEIEGKLQDFANLYVLGVRDQRSAIRYFRKNSAEFGVSPEKIIIGGWSTGATLSFAAAYLSEDEMRSFSDTNLKTTINISLDTYGGLDNGDNAGVSSQPNAAFIMMGLSFETTHMDSSIPLLLINHEKAVTVSDCQSNADEINIQTIDVSLKAYGTNLIFDEAEKSGLVEGQDLTYIYQTNWESSWKECDWYPNVSILTNENYPAIAQFFSQL